MFSRMMHVISDVDRPVETIVGTGGGCGKVYACHGQVGRRTSGAGTPLNHTIIAQMRGEGDGSGEGGGSTAWTSTKRLEDTETSQVYEFVR